MLITQSSVDRNDVLDNTTDKTTAVTAHVDYTLNPMGALPVNITVGGGGGYVQHD